ncbi:MAG TPA: phytanoyl-CoA dioxygenase family protein [Candidatus Acidoferrales bacterium]|nr:phytanoyl-CoA dioxygenase family protein [Candidatus Acidoferrales bacterium]
MSSAAPAIEIRRLTEGALATPDGNAPPLVTLPADSPAQCIFDLVEADGGVIVRDFLSRDLLRRLQSELRPFVEGSVPGSKEPDRVWHQFHGTRTKRFCGLAAKSPAFVELLLDPTLKAYADHFLLPRCGSYWLNTSQMMVVGPGEPAQFLHRDSANWPHFPWPAPEVTVSCMFALTDFAVETGATQVAPGSHRWSDPDRAPTASELTQAVMPAGSVLFYGGNVIHAAGENRTADRERWGMHVSWVLGWLRPEECHYLAVPIDVARKLPERVQQLLGYHSYRPSTYGGRLGLVDFEDARRVL